MGTPRLAEEDLLLPEQLLEGSLEGEWVRVSAYAKGHRVSANPELAYCGAILVYTEEWWEQAQAWALEQSGYENRAKGTGKWSPTPYFIARDPRGAASRCSTCKKGKDWGAYDITGPDLNVEVENTSPDLYRPFGDPTPADKLQAQRFRSKVAMVMRELGATLEHAE
jgi:hypothetical protein